MLKPFFTFFGGKWRAAPHYPAPDYREIVEPFAGAAGYSVRHSQKHVTLVEKDPAIAALWSYLITTHADDIRGLPDVVGGQSVDDFTVCPAAKTLIGFWLNKGTVTPCKTPSAWMRGDLRPKSYWGPTIRERIATQVNKIRHWEIYQGDYCLARNKTATWFIDPPYQKAGRAYRCSSRDINFEDLGNWCRSRLGQVMVCENTGATWLPFTHFRNIKSLEGKSGKALSAEALYTHHVTEVNNMPKLFFHHAKTGRDYEIIRMAEDKSEITLRGEHTEFTTPYDKELFQRLGYSLVKKEVEDAA